MQTRRLGRTGHHSSLLIVGTAAFWTVDAARAHAALDLALQAGLNHIDVAPQYGNAQALLGPWLESRRERFFLGCKTLAHTAAEARADLDNSLKLLRTDHFDLYQFHRITTDAELDAITAPGGAWETLQQARDQGQTRWLGITGHGMFAPRVHLEALRRMDLDTVMFPLNPRLYADPDYRRDAEALLAYAQAYDVGVMIIKSVAKGPWRGPRRYDPWYEPYDTADEIAAGMVFALSQPGVCAVVSPGDTRLLPLAIESTEGFEPMDAVTQKTLIEAHAGDVLIFDGAEGVDISAPRD